MNPKQIKTFSDYYVTYRCPSAPENPDRVLGLARTVYQRDFVRRLTPHEFLDVLFETLGIPGWGTKQRGKGVFHDFNPSIDPYGQPVEKRFLRYFKGRLKQNLKEACRIRSDQGKLHPAFKGPFPNKPRSGELHPTTYTPESTRGSEPELEDIVDWRSELAAMRRRERIEMVREAVENLPQQQCSVIREHYLKGCSFREVVRKLRMTRREAASIHDEAILRLRKTCA